MKYTQEEIYRALTKDAPARLSREIEYIMDSVRIKSTVDGPDKTIQCGTIKVSELSESIKEALANNNWCSRLD